MARVTNSTQDRLNAGEELAQMPDPDLCELVDGRIVPMSPTGEEHGKIPGNI